MAKKGLKFVGFGKYHLNNGVTTYTNGKHLSPAAAFNAANNSADLVDYGDDHDVETYNAFTGGNLTVELNNDEDELYTYLLGAQTSGALADQVIVSNVNDEKPYVGVGVVGQSGSSWVTKVYKKCIFSEPSDDNSTKTDTVTFGHISLAGRILIPDDGDWRIRKTFSTADAAISWLKDLFDIQ